MTGEFSAYKIDVDFVFAEIIENSFERNLINKPKVLNNLKFLVISSCMYTVYLDDA